jgi:peptidoglycan/xylan/chitin deacetylase (PgdA/CDA1 family)
MMRRLAKTGIARTLHWTGADALFDALAGSRGLPVVLGYHRVVEDFATHAAARPGMTISRRVMAQHLDWLARHFRIVPLDELGRRLADGAGRGQPLAAVTFDDGYQDVYEHAFPLLRERGIPAAVFVVTDLIGTSAVPLHDELYLLLARATATGCAATRDLGRFLHGLGVAPSDPDTLAGAWSPFAATRRLLRALPQRDLRVVADALRAHVEIDEQTRTALRLMTWEMLAEMARAGITVGSHTRSHPVLTNETAQTVLAEVAGSRQALERALGIPVRHFAYPGGHFNRGVVRAVADAGYRFGYTICRHRDPEHPLMTIPRAMPWEASCLDARGRFSPAIMSCVIRGIFAARCGDAHDESGGTARERHGRRPSAPRRSAVVEVSANPSPAAPTDLRHITMEQE